MTTATDNKEQSYSRPKARFDGDGNLEVRASAAGECRRALWYEAPSHTVTNPLTEESMTVLEASNALEPVVLRTMRRAGWEVTPADVENPQEVSLRLGPNPLSGTEPGSHLIQGQALVVIGHPDATGVAPFPDRGPGQAFGGKPGVIEVKTRGPEAYRQWRTLGAERSHPESVARAALYTYGTYGEARDAVIATMDTGSRQWDYEVIPAERVAQALEKACEWLGQLGPHYVLHGADPEALPERDFDTGDRQCKRCPFLNTCLPGTAPEPGQDGGLAEPGEPVSDDEAQAALREYEGSQEMLKDMEEDKQRALRVLRVWLGQRGTKKAKLEGSEKTRTVGLVQTRRFSVDHKKLNSLLDPETRAGIVTENVSEHLRVS